MYVSICAHSLLKNTHSVFTVALRFCVSFVGLPTAVRIFLFHKSHVITSLISRTIVSVFYLLSVADSW